MTISLWPAGPLTAAMVALLVVFPHYAVAATTATPLRVVRVGYPALTEYKSMIKALVESCQVIRKLPPSDAPLPSDAVLRQTRLSNDGHSPRDTISLKAETWK